MISADRARFLVNRFRERLWVKPLLICLLSIAGAFMARLADRLAFASRLPPITIESLETLLSVMAASMLVMATFAVGSMVAAYASASSAATPRSFPLVVADDVSQNALSTFLGAFIFSIVALTAVKNGYYGIGGRFTLLALTGLVFTLVILTFVRWVDRIARLGRLGATIDRVEAATAAALGRRRDAPTLGGALVSSAPCPARAVFAPTVGYVQHVDVAGLQAWAEKCEGRVRVQALPGAFVAPGRPVAWIDGDRNEADLEAVVRAFTVGGERLFDDDPRFGLVVLSEIAGRALSPGINDPGTAIDVVGTLVRLLVDWSRHPRAEAAPPHHRVEVPEVLVCDMFDDAFTAIARDGAGAVEVAVRLQKALESLAEAGDGAMEEVARDHARIALARSERALEQAEDLAAVRQAARFARASAA